MYLVPRTQCVEYNTVQYSIVQYCEAGVTMFPCN